MAAVNAALRARGPRPGEVRAFAHGMTVATNALLEGRGARTALIATEGFTDLVALGRQNRPDLYRLCAARPEPLVPAELRFGARERTGPEGVLEPLESVPAIPDDVESVAVVLLHSYRHPEHELAIGEALRGSACVSLSPGRRHLPRIRARRDHRGRRGALAAAGPVPGAARGRRPRSRPARARDHAVQRWPDRQRRSRFPCRLDGALRSCRRSRRSGVRGARKRRSGRPVLRHGRHFVRRLRSRRRHRAGARRGRDRGAADRVADARDPHRRRRRRVGRVARRGRRAARRSALVRCGARPRVLRAWRHRADSDRCERDARLPLLAGRRPRARP